MDHGGVFAAEEVETTVAADFGLSGSLSERESDISWAIVAFHWFAVGFQSLCAGDDKGEDKKGKD